MRRFIQKNKFPFVLIGINVGIYFLFGGFFSLFIALAIIGMIIWKK